MPVETVYPATFKPSYRNTEATHHFVEATTEPKTYSPAPVETVYPMPVETVYPATFKPSYRNSEATHHFVEATTGPKTYSPVQQIRQELSTTATVAGEQDTASEVPKPVEYTPSFEPEMLSAAPEKSYYTAAHTDYPHSEMPSTASMDYYIHSNMPSTEYYTHSDMASTDPIDYNTYQPQQAAGMEFYNQMDY